VRDPAAGAIVDDRRFLRASRPIPFCPQRIEEWSAEAVNTIDSGAHDFEVELWLERSGPWEDAR